MASQPSVFNEERNRLRLQAWEQRNQESSQTKELKVENVPLFGEPYKTNKGDELSSRIQRMLGSYEDVNHPNPISADPSPTPYATISQADQCQPDKPTKAPFHTQVSTQTQKGSSSNGYSSQPTRTSSSSPNQHGDSSTFSMASLTHSQGALVGQSAHEQKKSEAFSDFRDRTSLPQEMSAQSPDTKSQDFLHSGDLDTKDTINMRPLQGSIEHLSAPSSTMDVARMINKQSPKDASLPHANKTNALPSQTFPPLLSSKQPSAVMMQKPTAYVRPMDGQDQVVSESPDLKPSPEPYAPLPEAINKPDQGKIKTLPQFLETKTNEAQCVEDILKEMTHSWPPLLTAIHTPRTDEASKSPLSAKEAEHVSSCQVQKSSSPRDTPQLSQPNSLPSLNAVLSSGADSASSSDSESSSRSESDSESVAEEPNQPTVKSAVKTEPDAPAASHGDWQLWNWIRSNPQSSSTEGQGAALVSESPTHKQPVSIQSSKHSSVDVVNPIRESKLSSPQKEFSDNFAKPQQCSESSQDNYHQSCQQSPSADLFKRLCSVNSLKPVKAKCPDRTEAALSVKGEEDSATRVQDPCFTDRPKVKTKTRHSKKGKDSGDTKRDGKRTLKHLSLDKRKTVPEPEPEVTLVLYGHCPTCGVRYPNPCCCSSRSPAQPDQLSPAPPVRIDCNKVKSETTCQKGSKMPHKTSHKHSEKTGHAAKASKHHSGPPKSLLVKIDLGLLSRVPRTSSSRQEILNNTKRSAVVIEQDGAGSDASTIHKRTKASKKANPKNAELDNDSHPRKKQKLENKNTSSTHGSAKLDSVPSHEDREHKKAKRNHVQLQQPVTPKNTATGSKLHKHKSGDTQEPKEAAKSKEPSKHKKRSVTQSEHPHVEKQKAPKSSLPDPPASQPNRALLRFEDRQYPVKHYIKEAKRLKHKADAETDKLSKAFNYLDAAMYFVESGIAMEKDPQISVSSYTMFAETVELLKFVLKLKDPVDPSATPSEKDFLALCLKCQSLLHMAMFRHKHKTALEYSKILTNHFNSSAQTPHNPSLVTLKTTSSPLPSVSSPAGPGFSHSVAANSGLAVGSTTALPRAIEQVAFTYVNITMLFLSAHDTWEQAKELAHRGSGMLTELDTAIGPLSFTSTMSFMVRYTRQGVHWLRLGSQKVK